jgi:hypothetical protein
MEIFNLGGAIGYWESDKIACTLLYISHLPKEIQIHSLPLILWYHRCSFLSPPLISLLDSSSVSGYQLHMVMPQVHGELLVRTLYVCLHDQTLYMRWTYIILVAYIFSLFMYHILKCAEIICSINFLEARRFLHSILILQYVINVNDCYGVSINMLM